VERVMNPPDETDNASDRVVASAPSVAASNTVANSK